MSPFSFTDKRPEQKIKSGRNIFSIHGHSIKLKTTKASFLQKKIKKSGHAQKRTLPREAKIMTGQHYRVTASTLNI
jgi:hypothetical protein